MAALYPISTLLKPSNLDRRSKQARLDLAGHQYRWAWARIKNRTVFSNIL